MTGLIGNLFLWLIYLPVLTLLKCLFYFHPKIQSRLEFEFKNKTEPGCRSFAEIGARADLCFEFSSEGEYQQVASLIDDALLAGKKIELVFFSPSVEKSIVDLYQRFPEQIRYLRYPILNLSFSSWITSKELILVRYDLFPEFLIWALKPHHNLSFVWVTFKKERIAQKSVSLFKRAFLMSAKKIIYATEADAVLGNKMGFRGLVYDFRMEQIKRRIASREEKFAKLFPQYEQLKLNINQYPRSKRLIMGNAWPIDLALLEKLPQDVLVVIVPHQLKAEIIEEMTEKLKLLGRTPVIISDSHKSPEVSGTVLINKKGVLCELYKDFGNAYVGGGFGVSVHSLLEPLVAGCEHLSCGPVNHRSTEFDLARSLGTTTEVKSSQDFQLWLGEDIVQEKIQDQLKSVIEGYPQFRKEIISC